MRDGDGSECCPRRYGGVVQAAYGSHSCDETFPRPDKLHLHRERERDDEREKATPCMDRIYTLVLLLELHVREQRRQPRSVVLVRQRV